VLGQDSSGACEMDASDVWSQHVEEMGDRLNQQDSDRMGFLRMVNRNHLFNSSNYSLSSLFRYRDHTAAGSQKQCVIEPCCKDSHPLAFTVLTTCGLDFSMCPLQPPSTLSENSYGSVKVTASSK
jgi:hypothetical protein